MNANASHDDAARVHGAVAGRLPPGLLGDGQHRGGAPGRRAQAGSVAPVQQPGLPAAQPTAGREGTGGSGDGKTGDVVEGEYVETT